MIRKRKNVFNRPIVLAIPIIALTAGMATYANAAPTVEGNVIHLPDDGWYQVQRSDDYTEVCAGVRMCEVESGTYIVINHTTGERFERVSVNESEVDSNIMVSNNKISWQEDGWYQVQDAETYVSLCESTFSCSVEPGTYNVINHTTGERWENIVVGSSEPDDAGPVTDLSYERYSASAIELFWQHAEGAVLGAVYNIYQDDVLIGETDGRSFFLEGLPDTESYVFKIQAHQQSAFATIDVMKAGESEAPQFGDNVTIFTPDMPVSEIQATFDAIHEQQVSNEMGTERYGLYFMPGTYGTEEEPLQVQVGYYTEVAGLGLSPSDVQINGAIEVYNQCFDDPDNPEFVGCFALNNFWRALSNLTINVDTTGQGGCESSANMWAVSQAVSMRRVDVKNGNLTLMDYCSQPSFASGGFIADSRIADFEAQELVNGSQQQWYMRNSEVSIWSNAVWNQVFSGVEFTGDPLRVPVDADFPGAPYTVLETTPLSREKPFMYVDASGNFKVRVPAAKEATVGISWAEGATEGRSIPVSDFYIASPADSVEEINQQLASGKHLILTPGVYDIAESLIVDHMDTVILGQGIATLTAVGGAVPLWIADQPGIIVAGVTIDAGEVESPVLLQVGASGDDSESGVSPDGSMSDINPTTLSDVYFRVGGPHVGSTDIAMEVNSDNILIDHTWVWRADHGIEGFTGESFGDNERWATNIGRNGVVVNGDNVTATGLFVEHFQEYNTIWNGEGGRVVLYQNELPYDPPSQGDWMTPDGTLGWAGYKVSDDVTDHQLWGAGVYVYNRHNPSIVTENGFEAPEAMGVILTHIMTKNLSGPGVINSVVNGFGEAVDGVADPDDEDGYEDPSYVVKFPMIVQ